ncbi:MAG: phosphatase PAP2 family protein [Solimonas sp.]
MLPRALVAERRAATAALLLTALYTAVVLSSGRVDGRQFLQLAGCYVLIAALIAVAATMLLWLAAVLSLGLRSRFTASPFDDTRRRWRMLRAQGRIGSAAWPLIVFAVLLSAFNAFKQNVLPEAGFHLDPLLAQIDRDLLGGRDAGLLLHQLIGSPAATWLLDRAYHAWFVPTSLGVAFVAFGADATLRSRYMLSYVLVWVLLGSALAFLLPAAGPCFYGALVQAPSPFDPLREDLLHWQAALGIGRPVMALHYQQLLLDGLREGQLRIGRGISAMPSIHNALAVLFALAGFRIRGWLGVLLAAFAALIWIGSIYLGWHYAVDGVIGGAGAALIWFGVGALLRRAERDAATAVAPCGVDLPLSVRAATGRRGVL